MKSNQLKLSCLIGLGLIALASLGQLQRVQITTSLAVYLQDIGIFLWLLIYQWRHQYQNWNLPTLKTFFKLKPAIFWTLSWIFFGWVLALVQTGDWQLLIRPVLYLLRLSLILVFGHSLAKRLSFVWPAQSKKILPTVAIIFGLCILFWGLLQYFWLPDTRFLKTFGWDDHYYRLISTLFDPGFTGLILGITLFGWLGWVGAEVSRRSSLKPWSKILWLLISISLLGGILLTYSRASYLAIGLGLGWLGFKNRRNRQSHLLWLSLILILILELGTFILPARTGEGVNLQRTSTIISRIDTNQLAIKNLSFSQWWLGKGLFVTNRHQTLSQLPDHAQLPDNIFVTFLTGIGLGGLLVLVKLWGQKSWLYWQGLTSWIQSIWIAVLVHSLFNNSLFQPQIWLLLQLWLV